jgi:alkanesulfonate monooxygenase SsuD/methylene tetrahydromethanopterin reductase-like flavin-dependent oxidoreductase (luciferase family)
MTQRVRFGLNADPNTGGVAIAERITAIADSHGLELVGMQDHPYNDGFLDTFTLLTWLASKTASVHFVTNVANLPLRPPVMLAKQAATMDVLSGGRFELGLGAGAFWEGIAGMGGRTGRRGHPVSQGHRHPAGLLGRGTVRLPRAALPGPVGPARTEARP